MELPEVRLAREFPPAGLLGVGLGARGLVGVFAVPDHPVGFDASAGPHQLQLLRVAHDAVVDQDGPGFKVHHLACQRRHERPGGLVQDPSRHAPALKADVFTLDVT